VTDFSLNIMKFSDSLHESADTHGVTTGRSRVSSTRVAHQLFGSVVHCVELSDLVTEADTLKEDFDFIAGTGELEIVLADAQLSES